MKLRVGMRVVCINGDFMAKIGEVDKVKDFPGMPSYDRRQFSAADEGMRLEHTSWTFQFAWKPYMDYDNEELL
jgi:hypothetical protein